MQEIENIQTNTTGTIRNMEWFTYVEEAKNDILAQKTASQRDYYRRT